MASDRTLAEGSRLGRYCLERRLGVGGFGEVWLASGHTSGLVAIKTILPDLVDEPSAVARFEREIQVGAWLDHPCIPSVLDAGVQEESQARWFAMQFVEGEPFDRVMASPAEILRLFVQLLDILAYVHARGVIHRDIKPANLLVTAQTPDLPRTIKLVDFGIVQVAAHAPTGSVATFEDGAVGTVHYMSPEQARGEAFCAGPASDLYAVGVMLYERIAGRLPFAGETPISVLYKHMMEAPPPLVPAGHWPQLPEILERLVEDLLAKAYVARPQLAADAMQQLSPILETTQHHPLWTREPPAPTPHELAATADGDAEQTSAVPADHTMATGQLPALDLRSRLGQAMILRLRDPGPFGRAGEQALLWDAASRVATGNPPELIALDGALGSGRSRVTRWLGERCHRDGLLMPIRLDMSDGDLLGAVLRGLYDQLRRPRLERHQVERRLVEDLELDLDSEGWAHNLVDLLVLGDLGDFDRRRLPEEGSASWWPVIARLLQRFATRPNARPPLLWCTGVCPDVAPWLRALQSTAASQGWSFLAVLDRVPENPEGIRRLTLRAARRDALETLAFAMVPGLSARAAAALAEHAAGSPGLLRDTLIDLVGAGVFAEIDTGLTLGGVSLPATLDIMLQQRIAQAVASADAPDGCRRGLQTLALMQAGLGPGTLSFVFAITGGAIDVLTWGIIERQDRLDDREYHMESNVAAHLQADAAELDDRLGVAVAAWVAESLRALASSDWESARELLWSAWRMLDRNNVADGHNMRRVVLDGLSRISARQREAPALRLQAQDLELRAAAANQPSEWRAVALLWRAYAEVIVQDLDAAQQLLAEATLAASHSDNTLLACRVRHRSAQTSYLEGRLEDAARDYAPLHHDLNTFVSLPDGANTPMRWLDQRLGLVLRAEVLRDMAEIAMSLNRRDEGRSWLAEALGAFEDLDDPQGVAYVHLQSMRLERQELATDPEHTARRQQLVHHQHAATAALAVLDDRRGQANLQWEVARMHRVLKEPDAALAAFKLAGQYFGAAADRQGEALVENELGELCREHGLDAAARQHYLRFRSLADSLGLEHFAGVACLNLGWLALGANADADANRYFVESWSLLATRLPALAGAATVGAALAHARDGDLDAAADWLSRDAPGGIDGDVRQALRELEVGAERSGHTGLQAALASWLHAGGQS